MGEQSDESEHDQGLINFPHQTWLYSKGTVIFAQRLTSSVIRFPIKIIANVQ